MQMDANTKVTEKMYLRSILMILMSLWSVALQVMVVINAADKATRHNDAVDMRPTLRINELVS